MKIMQRWNEYQPSKEHTLWIALGGVIATLIVGFGLGGWVTAGRRAVRRRIPARGERPRAPGEAESARVVGARRSGRRGRLGHHRTRSAGRIAAMSVPGYGTDA
jgi:hypothetical protein